MSRQDAPADNDPVFLRAFRSLCHDFQAETGSEIELVRRLALLSRQHDQEAAIHHALIEHTVDVIWQRDPIPDWELLSPQEKSRAVTRIYGMAFAEKEAALCRLASAGAARSRLYGRIVEILYKRQDAREREAKSARGRTQSNPSFKNS